MTNDEQKAIIQTAGYLDALQVKLISTAALLRDNQLLVDYITIFVSGVPNTVWMPKGGETVRIGVGKREDSSDPIYDLTNVPAAWIQPSSG